MKFKKLLNEAEKKNCKIIMTEKDYYKIKNFKLKELDYLKVNH